LTPPSSSAPAAPPQSTAAPAAGPAAPAAEPERKLAAVHPPANLQPVAVVSSPAGATATLDGRTDAGCTTPCSLQAAPGHHDLAVAMPGRQIEHRDVDIESGPIELPPIILPALAGTLMLTTVPDGAAVSVNGRRVSQTTPAQLSLPPGNYKITVEKNGKQATSPVEIRNGGISYLRLLLE
jgi:hypothetical protein